MTALIKKEKADEYEFVCGLVPKKEWWVMQESFVAGAVRTPIGNLNGALSSLSATDLGSCVIQEAVRRTAIESRNIDEVIMGNVLSAGLGQAPGRQASRSEPAEHAFSPPCCMH